MVRSVKVVLGAFSGTPINPADSLSSALEVRSDLSVYLGSTYHTSGVQGSSEGEAPGFNIHRQAIEKVPAIARKRLEKVPTCTKMKKYT